MKQTLFLLLGTLLCIFWSETCNCVFVNNWKVSVYFKFILYFRNKFFFLSLLFIILQPAFFSKYNYYYIKLPTFKKIFFTVFFYSFILRCGFFYVVFIMCVKMFCIKLFLFLLIFYYLKLNLLFVLEHFSMVYK